MAAKDALNDQCRLISQAGWANFHEVKFIINTVSAAGNDWFVLDIRGDHYRVVAMIFFDIRTFIYGF